MCIIYTVHTNLSSALKEIAYLRDEAHIKQIYIKKLEESRTYLEEQLTLLKQAYYGKRSERHYDPNQGMLFDQETLDGMGVGQETEPVPEEEEPKPTRKPRGRKKRGIQSQRPLPVVEETLIPEVVQKSPDAWKKIGQNVTDILEHVPEKFFLRRVIRPKYVSRIQPELSPLQHKAPVRLVEGGNLGVSVITRILTGKYVDHLPLYRLEKIWKERNGVTIPRSTMCHAINKATDILGLIYDEIQRDIFGGGYVQIDETPVKFLKKGAGAAKKGYLWVAHRPGHGTLYQWGPGRGYASLAILVPPTYKGIIQCDGYKAYEKLKEEHPGVTLMACLAHIRRNFCKSEISSPLESLWYLDKIRKLYNIERELQTDGIDAENRARMRKEQSWEIYEKIKTRLEEPRDDLSPQHLLRKAREYALKHWKSLELMFTHGEVYLDNNRVENKIRPTAIGRKNWMFIGSEIAGDRTAMMYTLVQTCRELEIPVDKYLEDVLSQLPHRTNKNYHDLVPKAWKKRWEEKKDQVPEQ